MFQPLRLSFKTLRNLRVLFMLGSYLGVFGLGLLLGSHGQLLNNIDLSDWLSVGVVGVLVVLLLF